MVLSDIRVGWLVVMRNGQTSAVKCDGTDDGSLPFVKGFSLSDYNENLTSRHYPDFDIVEVYGWPSGLPRGGRISLYFKKYRELLWKDTSTNSTASTDTDVAFGAVTARVFVRGNMLALRADCENGHFECDVCPCYTRDEVVSDGERVSYSVFRSLSAGSDGDGKIIFTVTAAEGDALYRKSEGEVLADERRSVYTFCLDGSGLRRI